MDLMDELFMVKDIECLFNHDEGLKVLLCICSFRPDKEMNSGFFTFVHTKLSQP